jgi:hypothetical protein
MRIILFEELARAYDVAVLLQEKLTYDQLFRMSEPKRWNRSLTVKMPPLEMQQFQTGHQWCFDYYFNAKAKPSTTGLRHRGMIRFIKPKDAGKKNTPLSKLHVEIDCQCPDYRYRWAYMNHQRGAGPIGPDSLNQCINKAPKKTNPHGLSGMCKHILATRDYIYGQLTGFPEDLPDTEKLDRLTKRATKRWLNFDDEMRAAKERSAKIAMAKARRNIGVPPKDQNKPLAKPAIEPAPPLPPDIETTEPAEPAKPTAQTPEIPGVPPEQFMARRFLKTESVGSLANMKILNAQEGQTLAEALKIIEDIEDSFDEVEGPDEPMDMGDEMPPPSGADMPIEPPVSDSAVGASTGDNVALGLLGEIRDLLAKLAANEGGEAETELEMPPEGETEQEMEKEEEKDEPKGFRPGKRPMPQATGAE